MDEGGNFRESLQRARKLLRDTKADLRRRHDQGVSGVSVCSRLTQLADQIVLSLFNEALDDLALEDLRSHVALVAVGGYGRRDISPYSDIDLMILHEGKQAERVETLVKRLTQDMFDVGFDLGHSVRTPTEARSLARSDATVLTTLIESRSVCGSQDLFEKFRTRFKQMATKSFRSLYKPITESRDEERKEFGETVYLLEPNIKRSRGGLRDLQLMRWIGYTKFGEAEADRLNLVGAISNEDRRTLRAAREFLLRLRNELHFHADKPQDILYRHEQVRMAEKFGYRGTTGLLPVENFMREYFRKTTEMGYVVARFTDSLRPEPLARAFDPVFSYNVANEYRVGPAHIAATREGLVRIEQDVGEILRLADYANRYNKRIAHPTWQAVCRAAPRLSSDLSDDVIQRFLSLMAQPGRLGSLLRRLNELGVLEKIIPAMKHARFLLQFNQYHKFTVDEHCIRAVEAATRFEDDDGPVGEAYRQIKNKRALHLALLLHDLGKGMPEDHSEVGRRIAIETAERLKLPKREGEVVAFLVHKHLMMSHLALRRDLGDEQLVVRFAVEVGSPDVLRLLYVLTCADLAAVGPGVLNSWKLELLTELYRRTMSHLTSDADASPKWISERRQAVVRALGKKKSEPWMADQIELLDGSLLVNMTASDVAAVLERIRELKNKRTLAWGRFLAETQTTEYYVALARDPGPGAFCKFAGELSSLRLEILSAEIHLLAEGVALDRFVVRDPDFSGEPPATRIEEVSRRLVSALKDDAPPSFQKVWNPRQNNSHELSPLESEVRIDNDTSEGCTIVEVFTFDRRGLLYTVAKELDALDLSIHLAKIGTYLDQVVDVFYVTDSNGNKIVAPARLDEVRERLLASIEAFQDNNQHT